MPRAGIICDLDVLPCVTVDRTRMEAALGRVKPREAIVTHR
jgi:hypothetical protein